MKLMKWQFEGSVALGRKVTKFSKVIEAPTQAAALDQLFAWAGSKHRLKRRQVAVEKVTKLD